MRKINVKPTYMKCSEKAHRQRQKADKRWPAAGVGSKETAHEHEAALWGHSSAPKLGCGKHHDSSANLLRCSRPLKTS